MRASLATRIALGMIDLYQRWVSPRKGWRCAHALHTGRRGCSALGARAIRRHGVWRGLGVLRRRFDACALSHQYLQAQHRIRPNAQAGFCDADCSGLDGCDSGCAGNACDVASSCGNCGGCDTGNCRSARLSSCSNSLYRSCWSERSGCCGRRAPPSAAQQRVNERMKRLSPPTPPPR